MQYVSTNLLYHHDLHGNSTTKCLAQSILRPNPRFLTSPRLPLEEALNPYILFFLEASPNTNLVNRETDLVLIPAMVPE